MKLILSSFNKLLCLFALILTVIFSTTLAQAQNNARIDILVLYDNSFNNAYNGSPNTAIFQMINTANNRIALSGVGVTLNLVGSRQLNIGNNNIGAAALLNAVRNNNAVRNLRNDVGADIVTYLTDRDISACGVAFQAGTVDRAYNVVTDNCLNLSFVHELGHNFGLGHLGGGTFHPYGTGYGDVGVFRTIMVQNGTFGVENRTFRYSNPDRNCAGVPCGDEEEGDAARSMNQRRFIMRNFRNQVNSTTVVLRKRNAVNFAIDGGNGGSNGQNIFLFSANNGNNNQRWVEIPRGGSFYSYRKVGTNQCIDGGNGGSAGQNVRLFQCGANNQNQHWRKISLNGSFRLQKRNAPGFSLDGNNGGGNGQNVHLWHSNNGNQNQRWNFSVVD